jgi:integral membrane protein
VLSTSLGRLRLVGLLEGVSFLVLLGVAMPLKYLAGWPDGVRVIGAAHGVLFVLFAALLAREALARRWPLGRLALGLASAVLPGGPFLFDRVLRGEGAAGAPRGATGAAPARGVGLPAAAVAALLLSGCELPTFLAEDFHLVSVNGMALPAPDPSDPSGARFVMSGMLATERGGRARGFWTLGCAPQPVDAPACALRADGYVRFEGRHDGRRGWVEVDGRRHALASGARSAELRVEEPGRGAPTVLLLRFER